MGFNYGLEKRKFTEEWKMIIPGLWPTPAAV